MCARVGNTCAAEIVFVETITSPILNLTARDGTSGAIGEYCIYGRIVSIKTTWITDAVWIKSRCFLKGKEGEKEERNTKHHGHFL
jgi:hypothetical protein